MENNLCPKTLAALSEIVRKNPYEGAFPMVRGKGRPSKLHIENRKKYYAWERLYGQQKVTLNQLTGGKA